MISLFAHNQKAYEAAEEMLSLAGKAAVIHPTGTGKSFIGFKLCEQHPDKRICWLGPSSYIYETQLEALKAAAERFCPENIIFHTYAKLSILGADELYSIRPDYIILDEFHRCGAPVWGEAVQRLLKIYPQTPVLGLSATNVRYLDSQRDMALELFDGCVASEMTLGEAVVCGILTPPKYVLSVFSYQKDLEKYRQRIKRAKSAEVRSKADEYLEALRRALDKAEGLDEIFRRHMPDRAGKYIIFCANREHMEQMMDKAAEWFSKVDTAPCIYSVYSEDPTAEQSFRDFKENNDPEHLKLLYCIDALNEGVHVKDISGVILLRPTVSPIIYKQQIGRAMSANAKHDVVIFDIVMNIDNLYSISALKNEMDSAVRDYVFSGESRNIVNESFEVIDEVKDCRKLFEQLNDTLSASWEMMYAHARAYYEKHGDLDVPYRYRTEDGYSLGPWLMTQRRVYRGEVSGVLTAQQKKKLDAISMRWDSSSDESWEKYFAAAERFYEDKGHLRIKAQYQTEDGIKLGAWISYLRNLNNKGHEARAKTLSPERRARLNSIGMIWDVHDTQWEMYFSAAEKYFKKHKNLMVPDSFVTKDGIRLGAWVYRMRSLYEKKDRTGLNEERIQRLEAIGMVWQNRKDNLWFSVYEEAKKYFEEHGNIDVPTGYKTEEGLRLGSWVMRQREYRQENKLASEKIELLNAIGMMWEKPRSWERRLDAVRHYYEEHGHINISTEFVVDGFWVGRWLREQRKKKDKLSPEQIRLLDEMGMQW